MFICGLNHDTADSLRHILHPSDRAEAEEATKKRDERMERILSAGGERKEGLQGVAEMKMDSTAEGRANLDSFKQGMMEDGNEKLVRHLTGRCHDVTGVCHAGAGWEAASRVQGGCRSQER